MSDERLVRDLRMAMAPVRPDSAFVEDLYTTLSAELGLGPAVERVGGQLPRRRVGRQRRSRLGWWSVIAALLVLAVSALLVGQLGRARLVPPLVPSQEPSAAPTGSVAPSAVPSPSASSSSPAQASVAPSLDALRSDGLVVFERGGLTNESRLRVLHPDLSSAELLPDQPGLQRRATWNPDGSRIAFGVNDLTDLRGRALIWETDAQGSEPRLLSEGCDPPECVEENDPSYSPDGARLVFVRTRAADGDPTPVTVLAVHDLQTGSVDELEPTSRQRDRAEIYHPRWSPDGTTIAYAVAELNADGGAIGSTIRLVDADGSNDRAITPSALEAGDPEWAPDGTRLLFSTWPIRLYHWEQPQEMHLYTMAVDGSDVRRLPANGPVGAASWTSSGEQILFSYIEAPGINSGTPVLFVMDGDGSHILPVTSTDSTPAWYAVQQPRP
jgi:hypothetical protein